MANQNTININQDIPRRQLTIDSTNLLRATILRVLKEILKESCPCRYPRFRNLVSFKHDDYEAIAVFCADTNYLIGCASNPEIKFLQQTGRITENVIGDYEADLIYTCSRCSSRYKKIARQYSINFEFEYLIALDDFEFKNDGAAVDYPIPLLQGLFGFDDNEILKCAHHYTLSTAEEFYNYLTKKA
jgi:hypothetical protein